MSTVNTGAGISLLQRLDGEAFEETYHEPTRPMKVVAGTPPMFTEIDRKFHVIGKPIVFAWGDTIYNPTGSTLPPWILAHEGVHGARQGCDVEGWWRLYIDDAEFRLQEEIPAHQEEWRAFGLTHSRPDRLFYLSECARKLSSPLYGSLVSYGAAKRIIRQ